MNNPYASPNSQEFHQNSADSLIYAGFWTRFFAGVIDSIVLMVALLPICFLIYGTEYWESEKMIQGPADFFINYIVPFFLVVILWVKCGGTPGKILLRLRVVDENTLKNLTIGKAVIRYIAYFLSTIPLLLGFFWMIWQPRKQCWHDILSGSIVIKVPKK